MTKTEIVNQMNNIRATLQKDQTLLLELLNQVMGCTMLTEKLMTAVKEMEEPVSEVDVVEEPVADEAVQKMRKVVQSTSGKGGVANA